MSMNHWRRHRPKKNPKRVKHSNLNRFESSRTFLECLKCLEHLSCGKIGKTQMLGSSDRKLIRALETWETENNKNKDPKKMIFPPSHVGIHLWWPKTLKISYLGLLTQEINKERKRVFEKRSVISQIRKGKAKRTSLFWCFLLFYQ